MDNAVVAVLVIVFINTGQINDTWWQVHLVNTNQAKYQLQWEILKINEKFSLHKILISHTFADFSTMKYEYGLSGHSHDSGCDKRFYCKTHEITTVLLILSMFD